MIASSTEIRQAESPRVPPVRRAGPRATPTGPIRSDEIYSKGEFCRRAGWAAGAFTEAKRRGLKTVIVGGRLFIRGCWFAEFLERMAGEVSA